VTRTKTDCSPQQQYAQPTNSSAPPQRSSGLCEHTPSMLHQHISSGSLRLPVCHAAQQQMHHNQQLAAANRATDDAASRTQCEPQGTDTKSAEEW
jgi:hypothetical protein